MSLSPSIEVVCGVKLNKTQLKIFRKKYKPGEYVLKYFEVLKNSINEKGLKSKEGFRQYDWILNPYVVRNKKRDITEPVRYHWDKSKKLLKEIKEDPYPIETIEAIAREKAEIIDNDLHDIFYLPRYKEDPPILGTRIERSIDRVLWHLTKELKFSESPRLIKEEGTRPWETGIIKTTIGYVIYNPIWLGMRKEVLEENEKILNNHGIAIPDITTGYKRKKDLIKYAKKAWYILYPNKIPYLQHPHELWGWGEPNYRRVEIHLKVLKELYGIDIDPLKMGRWIYMCID